METCGFSPASAGLENATAGSEASRSDEGALSRYAKRIVESPMQHSLTFVPTASPTLGDLSPKLEALSQRTCELRKVSCNTHCVRSSACGYAVQPAMQIALRLFGQDGDFPRLQPKWKMRQHGGILLDSACRFPARVEFQACFRQKPTAAHFSFTAMAFSCP